MRNSDSIDRVERPTAQQYGAIKNYLNILSEDNKRVRPKAFAEIADLNISHSSTSLHISRPSAYQKYVTLKPEVMAKVTMLVMATDIIYELLDKNVQETKKWVVSPNTMLFGDTPFEVCMRGDGEKLLKWLYEHTDQRSPLELPSHVQK